MVQMYLPAAKTGDPEAKHALAVVLMVVGSHLPKRSVRRWRAVAGISRDPWRPLVPDDDASARTLRRRRAEARNKSA
jgi:hypothetical protein